MSRIDFQRLLNFAHIKTSDFQDWGGGGGWGGGSSLEIKRKVDFIWKLLFCLEWKKNFKIKKRTTDNSTHTKLIPVRLGEKRRSITHTIHVEVSHAHICPTMKRPSDFRKKIPDVTQAMLKCTHRLHSAPVAWDDVLTTMKLIRSIWTIVLSITTFSTFNTLDTSACASELRASTVGIIWKKKIKDSQSQKCRFCMTLKCFESRASLPATWCFLNCWLVFLSSAHCDWFGSVVFYHRDRAPASLQIGYNFNRVRAGFLRRHSRTFQGVSRAKLKSLRIT